MIRMKLIIKKTLSIFGVGIHRLPKKPNAQGLPIRDPISHNTLERLNEFYSDPKIVRKYISPERVAFYHSIIRLCSNKGMTFTKKSIADVGCGTGHLLKFISEDSNDVTLTGFEYSDEAIKMAKTVSPKATFFKFDIYQGTSQQFDVVFCVECFEHLLYPNKALKNCQKMIRKRGTLMITVPNGRRDTFLGHINFWSPESWKVFVETNCEGLRLDIGLTGSGANYAIIQRENEK